MILIKNDEHLQPPMADMPHVQKQNPDKAAGRYRT